MVEFSVFGQERPPAEPPRPAPPETWADLHDRELKRWLFIKYLIATHRMGDTPREERDGC